MFVLTKGVSLSSSLQGMPEEWMVLLDKSGISAREQKNNPEVRGMCH